MGTRTRHFELDQLDPSFIRKVTPFLDGLYRHYFRCEVKGLDKVPRRPVIIVGNHNGLVTFEVLMLFYAWWKKFGLKRRALGLSHSIALKNAPFSWLIPKLGGVPARPDVAEEALSKGYSVLAFPGGLKECFRPFGERRQVNFYQHKGFIRLALKTGAPIVPVVSVGAHESYVILGRGEDLAERLGLRDKLRLCGLPVTFRSIFFLWCMVTGIFTFFPLLLAPAAFAAIFVPMPAKMTFKFLEPIDVAALVNPTLSEEDNVQRIYDYVMQRMQSVLSMEYEKRWLPVLG